MATPNKYLEDLTTRVTEYQKDPNNNTFDSLSKALNEYISAPLSNLNIEINGKSLSDLCLDETNKLINLTAFLALTKKGLVDTKSLTKLMNIARHTFYWSSIETNQLQEIFNRSINQNIHPDFKELKEVSENYLNEFLRFVAKGQYKQQAQDIFAQYLAKYPKKKIEFQSIFESYFIKQLKDFPNNVESMQNLLDFGNSMKLLNLNLDKKGGKYYIQAILQIIEKYPPNDLITSILDQCFSLNSNNKKIFQDAFEEFFVYQFTNLKREHNTYKSPSYQAMSNLVALGKQYQILDLNKYIKGNKTTQTLLEHYLDTVFAGENAPFSARPQTTQNINFIESCILLLKGTYPYSEKVFDKLEFIADFQRNTKDTLTAEKISQMLKAKIQPAPPAPYSPFPTPAAITAYFGAKDADAKSEKEPAKPSSESQLERDKQFGTGNKGDIGDRKPERDSPSPPRS